MSRTDQIAFALFGAGRAGRAVARSLRAAGARPVGVASRTTASAQEAARELGCPALELPSPDQPATRSSPSAFPPADLWILAVPDPAIAPLAAKLTDVLPLPRWAFHLSGALRAEALGPLRLRGCAVAAFHPVRPFAGRADEDLAGALVVIEGDPRARELAVPLAEGAGARPFLLDAEAKPLYHAAAALAASGAATLLELAIEVWRRCGFSEEEARRTLGDLARGAIALRQGAEFPAALTGPVARGDEETVRAHLAALGPDAEARDVYRRLAAAAARRLGGRALRVLAVTGESEDERLSPR